LQADEKRRIKNLHIYNETRDATMEVMGKLAEVCHVAARTPLCSFETGSKPSLAIMIFVLNGKVEGGTVTDLYARYDLLSDIA